VEELKPHHSKELVCSFLKLRNMRHHTTTTRLGFIYAAYTPSLWWFEIEELFRKLLLNGAMVFVHSDKPPAQLMTGALLCILAMMLLLLLHPYPRDSDHYSAIAAQAQLCLSLLLALVLITGIGLFSDHRGAESAVVTSIIVLSCVCTVLFIGSELVAKVWRALQQAQHALREPRRQKKGVRGSTVLAHEVRAGPSRCLAQLLSCVPALIVAIVAISTLPISFLSSPPPPCVYVCVCVVRPPAEACADEGGVPTGGSGLRDGWAALATYTGVYSSECCGEAFKPAE
jgi:hypothetical protein